MIMNYLIKNKEFANRIFKSLESSGLGWTEFRSDFLKFKNYN